MPPPCALILYFYFFPPLLTLPFQNILYNLNAHIRNNSHFFFEKTNGKKKPIGCHQLFWDIPENVDMRIKSRAVGKIT